MPDHANALLTDARNLRKKLKCQENFVRKCRNNWETVRGHANDPAPRSQGSAILRFAVWHAKSLNTIKAKYQGFKKGSYQLEKGFVLVTLSCLSARPGYSHGSSYNEAMLLLLLLPPLAFCVIVLWK